MSTYKLTFNGNTLTYPGWNGYISYEEPKVIRNVVLNQQTGGTIAAAPMSGYDGDVVTLSNTADTGYTFGSYSITGATLTSNKFVFNDSDVTVKPNWNHTQYSVTLTQVAGGRIAASPTTGYYGTQVTLSNTPSAEYTFGSYSITGATLTSNKFNFGTSNVTAKGSFTQKTYTLTLQTDGHGKLAASKTTGHKGDTVTLTPTYSSYYRFNNYAQTGGSISNNTFTFGSQNATAKANFKVNAFTARGGWEKGSNVGATAKYGIKEGDAVVGTKYAVHQAHTGSVPTAWYATSNRWKVTSTVSGYKITLEPKMSFHCNGSNTGSTYNVTGVTLLGSTQTQSQHLSRKGTGNLTYSKSFTASNTGVNYGISAHIHSWAKSNNASITYSAALTTGTWTATGYLP